MTCPKTARPAATKAFAGILLVGAVVMLPACRAEQQAPAPSATSQQTQAPAPVITPVAQSALDRTGLLAAFALAADSTAGGKPLPAPNMNLVGREFAINLPIGCSHSGQTDPNPSSNWTYQSNRRTIKLTVRPENWSHADWVRAIAGNLDYEAAEGFWIEQPWTSSEECPDSVPESAAAKPSAEEPPTVGIAQFFAADSPRTFRRGARPYTHTERRKGDAAEARRYSLALTGRIAGFPDGQPIHCSQAHPTVRPVCLMAVEWDRIAFKDASGNVLTEWQN